MFIYDDGANKIYIYFISFKTYFVERCSLQYSITSILLTPNNQFLIIPDTIYKGGPSLIQNVGPFKIVTYY